MKQYFLFSLVTASLMSSAAMAMVDREEELLQALDSKAAKVALQAINNEYNVNWGEFDFKNSEDDKRATNVVHYLDAVLRSKSTKWHEKSAKIRRETGDYQHPLCIQYSARGTEYYDMQSALSDSWSRAFSDSLGPQDEVFDEEIPSILPNTSGPSSSSMTTSPEVRLEDLDEKETKAVLRALTHKFEVTDPADRENSSKVNQYLRVVLERKQQVRKQQGLPDKNYSSRIGS